MNTIRRTDAEPHANAFSSGSDTLCDKMDAGSEWERSQQQPRLGDMNPGAEMAHAFEFDIHDCSISEVSR